MSCIFYYAKVVDHNVCHVDRFITFDPHRSNVNVYFATSAAAAAFLSRVYLQQENYSAAAAAADRVISSGAYSLNSSYAACFNNEGNTAEDIFAIQVTTQDGVNNMNTFFAFRDFGGRGDIPIVDAHFDIYESGDERLDLFYEAEGLTWTGKWVNTFANINVIRLAEMYLTRAEANHQAGTSVGNTPVNDINVIRARAGLTPLGAVSLDDIKRERQIELAFEGQRIHDLRRWKDNTGDFPYNDPAIVFPIPQREIDANANLNQNPGY